MILKRYLLIIYILFIAFSVFSQKSEAKKICILYSESEYKNELLKILIKKIEQLSYIAVSDKIKNHKNHNFNEYAVVVILTGAESGNPLKDAVSCIIENNYSKKIIYFCSTEYKNQAYGNKLDKQKIDAFTSASNKNNLDKVSGMLIEKIKSIINQ